MQSIKASALTTVKYTNYVRYFTIWSELTEQFRKIIGEAAALDTPTAMPHRFRGPFIKYAFSIMDREMLYQTIKQRLEISNGREETE